jgi:CheY-like chemotaxis protein
MKSKKILVVDDSEINIELMRRYLEEEGFEVATVQQSDMVLSAVKEEKPDVIVMDIIMPGVKGDRLAQEIKNDPETKSIPVVLITADIFQEKAGLAAEYFVRRPLIGEELIEVLENVFLKQP